MERKFKNRLLKLADFLEKLPKKLFDIDTVAQCDGPANEALPEALEHPRRSCGSVACALGWSPACFPRQIEWSESDNVVLKDGSSKNWWGTAEVFFGLTKEEVNYLFTGDFYEYQVMPKQVAKVIRKFVADEGHLERRQQFEHLPPYWEKVWMTRDRKTVKEAK